MKEPRDSPLFTQLKMFCDLYNIAVLDQIFVVNDPWEYLMKKRVGIWRQRELEEFGCQVGRFVGTTEYALGLIDLVSSTRQTPLDQSKAVDDQKSPQQTGAKPFVDAETDPVHVGHGQEITEEVYTEEQTTCSNSDT